MSLRPSRGDRPPASNVSISTTRAGFWLLSGKFLARSLDLVSLLVLARLLSPEDFGLVAIATTVLVIVETVFDLPLVQALVRQGDLSDSMLTTAFTLGLMRGLTICLIMVLAAWPLAWIYGDPRLTALLAALALAPAMRSVVSPRLVLFMQRFDFRPEFALDLIQKGATWAVAIGAAILTGSYWSLAIGSVVGPTAAAAASYVIAPMRPAFGLSEWARFKDMIGWHTVAQVLSAFTWQIDRLLLPRFTSLSVFGNFTVADNLASIPHQTFVGPLIRPLMAAFSKFEPGTPPLAAAFLKATHALVLVGAPILIVLAFLAEPVIAVVAGSGWDAAALILQWLCFASLIGLPAIAMPPLAMVLDRTQYATLRMALEFAARVPLTVAGLMLFGLMGALFARVASAVVAYLASAFLSRRLIGVSLALQFRTLLLSLLPALPMIAFLAFAQSELAGDIVDLRLILTLGTSVALALGIFWVSALALWTLRGRPAGLESTIVQMAADLLEGWRQIPRKP